MDKATTEDDRIVAAQARTPDATLEQVARVIANYRFAAAAAVREQALNDAMAALKKVGDFRGVAVVRKLLGGANGPR